MYVKVEEILPWKHWGTLSGKKMLCKELSAENLKGKNCANVVIKSLTKKEHNIVLSKID